MKKIILLIIQLIVLSFWTFGEIMFFYKVILMNTHTKITTWMGIIIGSFLIAGINMGILRLINRHTKLHLNIKSVYFLSAVAASGLCFISGLMFDKHSIMETIDFNKKVDYIMLFFFSLCPIIWSVIISLAINKIKN